MEKHNFRAESQSHTESELKVLLGELGFVTTSKALRCPQGLPHTENTGENITRSFRNGYDSQVYPYLTDSYLKSSSSRIKDKVLPEPGE